MWLRRADEPEVFVTASQGSPCGLVMRWWPRDVYTLLFMAIPIVKTGPWIISRTQWAVQAFAARVFWRAVRPRVRGRQHLLRVHEPMRVPCLLDRVACCPPWQLSTLQVRGKTPCAVRAAMWILRTLGRKVVLPKSKITPAATLNEMREPKPMLRGWAVRSAAASFRPYPAECEIAECRSDS
ncbi:MAG: hypothetical protein K0S42_3209 [Microvirga sp.]|jgi:hypothetical protein|nr:hypothetical protein [Microvirga sp.]